MFCLAMGTWVWSEEAWSRLEGCIWELSGSDRGLPPGPKERSEAPGWGSRKQELLPGWGRADGKACRPEEPSGDRPVQRAEGGRERGLDGLAGPVKRFGLSLIGKATPSEYFRQGPGTGSLAFRQDLSNHGSKNGLERRSSER